MIPAVLATADLFTAGLRRELSSPFSDLHQWIDHWRHRLHVRRFMAIRADVYRDLREDLLDGSDIQDALGRLIHIYTNKGRDDQHPALPALRAWHAPARRADPLSQLLRGWAPSYDITLVLAGEMAGTIKEDDGRVQDARPRMLGRLADQIDIQSELVMLFLSPVGAVLQSLITALLLLGVSIFVTVPILRPMIDPGRLAPLSPGGVLLFLSDVLNEPYSIFILMPVIASVLWLAWSFQNWSHPIRLWAERHISLYGIYRDLAGVRFLKALAPFKVAGISDAEALDKLSQEGTPYERSRVVPAAQYCINYSYSIGESFDQAGHNFPHPSLIIRLITTHGRQTQSKLIEDMVDRHLAVVRRRVDRYGRSVSNWGWLLVFLVLLLQTFAEFQLIRAATISTY